MLEALCGQAAPSGFETSVARTAMELLRPLVDEVYQDRLGNVIGMRRCGREGAPLLLLDAHLDEIGLIVTGVEDGFLRFRSIGGVDPRVLVDQEMTVLTEPPLFGVVSCLPPHVLKAGDSDKAQTIEQLAIDIGLPQEKAEQAVPVGTPVVCRSQGAALGVSRFCGRALDDRACFAVLLRAAQLLQDTPLDVDLCLLGSVFEETGGWGAQTAAYGLAPDYCVAVDVTFARSSGVSEEEAPCKLGGRPAVGVGPIIPRWMSGRFKAKAAQQEIPCQTEILSGRTGTNGDDFQTAREGIATAVLSLPLRYMHTPAEVVDLEDMERTARLLSAFAKDLGKEAEQVC